MRYKTFYRWQTENIKNSLLKRRVLILAGARQCGKTTLSQTLCDSTTIYRNLDDSTLYESAKNDPEGFIYHEDELMIIDEVQRVPELLQAIKRDVDENQQPGRYLLTGSTNLQSLPGVTESLAGRVRKLQLRPLAQGEILSHLPTFMEDAFQQFFHVSKTSFQNKDSYIKAAMKGGYPEAVRLDTETDIKLWHKDYFLALLERDLKDIVNIRRKDSMKKLMEILCAWSSKFMDISQISRSLAISRPTVESYINALEALYLIERLRPWAKSDYIRISKQDKLFISDSGMMTSMLNWNFDKVRLDGELNGKLIETFVYNQLMTLLSTQPQYEIYHYRDRDKREVDFIIQDSRNNTLGLEVKAGSNVNAESFKHLKWFSEHELKTEHFIGLVLYTGKEVVPFGKNMWAVPINALWSKGR